MPILSNRKSSSKADLEHAKKIATSALIIISLITICVIITQLIFNKLQEATSEKPPVAVPVASMLPDLHSKLKTIAFQIWDAKTFYELEVTSTQKDLTGEPISVATLVETGYLEPADLSPPGDLSGVIDSTKKGSWRLTPDEVRLSGVTLEMCQLLPSSKDGISLTTSSDAPGEYCTKTGDLLSYVLRPVPLSLSAKGVWVIKTGVKSNGTLSKYYIESNGELEKECPKEGKPIGYLTDRKWLTKKGFTIEETITCIPATKEDVSKLKYKKITSEAPFGIGVNLIARGKPLTAYVGAMASPACFGVDVGVLAWQMGVEEGNLKTMEIPGNCYPATSIPIQFKK